MIMIICETLFAKQKFNLLLCHLLCLGLQVSNVDLANLLASLKETA